MAAIRDRLVSPKVMPVRSGHHHIPNAFDQEISPSLATPWKAPPEGRRLLAIRAFSRLTKTTPPFSVTSLSSAKGNIPSLCDLCALCERQFPIF
jgi:hypothetical protein